MASLAGPRRVIALLAALALAPGAGAAEVRETSDAGGTSVASAGGGPPSAPPPSADEALAEVSALAEAVRAGAVDVPWLEAHVRPAQLPAGYGRDAYARLATALSPGGALGRAVAEAPSSSVVQGPDYTRVILEGERLVSVVLRRHDDRLVIDRFEATSCALCDERARFVRDLLADVRRRGADAHRLVPGVDLDVSGRGRGDGRWEALYQARSVKGGALPRLLAGAEVVGVDGSEVLLTYADGTADRWHVVYREGRWQVDYGALPESSPIRMSAADLATWRDPRALRRSTLQAWTPTFQATADGTGIQVGHQALGAAFDPHDGTILVAVQGLDRVLSGLLRVDPAGEVLERLSFPPAPNPVEVGDEARPWRLALSPDGHGAAVALAGRVQRLDLDGGPATSRVAPARIERFVWRTEPDEQGADRDVLLLATARQVELRRPEGSWRQPLDGRPVGLDLHGDRVLVVTHGGVLQLLDRADGTPLRRQEVCAGEAVDAALRPGASELLVACGTAAGVALQRVSLVDGAIVVGAGAGSARRGASWSPDGTLYTTPAQGADDAALLLWDAATDQPVARVGEGAVHEVRWSLDGESLLTVGIDGRVWLWDVPRLRQRGLGEGPDRADPHPLPQAR